MKKRGFTLAEVLITLGVIGIVAAMTLPALVNKYKEKQRVSQLKKTYSILSQAFQMATNEYGDITGWGLTDTNTGNKDDEGNAIYDNSSPLMVANRFKKYIKLSSGKNKHEFRAYQSLDGRNYSSKGDSAISNKNKNILYLTDGTIVMFGWSYADCAHIARSCGDIEVFLPESIAKLGVSTFWFYITPEGIRPYGHDGDLQPFSEFCDINNSNGINSVDQGRGCAAWVIYNGNMDYLHCPEKLGWDKASSCKK